MKTRFFGTRIKLTIISIVVILLLEAIALPLGFMMLRNSEMNNEMKQKKAALTSLSTSFRENFVGELLYYDNSIFEIVYRDYKGVSLRPGSEETAKYFEDYKKTKDQMPIIGMTQIGPFRNLVLSSLQTTLVPSSSAYLYLAIYDPSTNIAVVSMGACIEGDDVFSDSVREGYFFSYDYPTEDGFEIYNHYYEDEYKGNIFVNVRELEYKHTNSVSNKNLHYLVISEVNVQTLESPLRKTTLQYFFIILITGLTLLAVFILLTHFFFSKKVKALSSLSSKKKEGIIDGNFDKQFNLHTKHVYDEIDVLNDDLYYLEDELNKYVAQVEENVKISEKKKLEDELSSKIQLSSLPSKIIHNDYISITPIIKPAKAVGGDLYDYFYIDDDRFAFFIGDVSGKGVPAALFMMKAKTLIKYALMSNDSILDAINYVNEQLLVDNEAFLFITAFFGIVNTKEGTLTYVNAGHEKPLFCKGCGYEYLEIEPNIPLGISEFSFVEGTIPLNDGDTVFMYTDGVSEAKDSNDELFGYERIKDILNANCNKPDFVLSNLVLEELETFNRDHEQDDDICMLTFKYKPSIITIGNDINELEKVKRFVKEKLSFVENEDVVSEINVIVDELVSNVIHYAYKGCGEIDISISFDEKDIYLYLVDNGTPFDPFLHVETRGLDEIGGLGISMVKTMSTSYDYKFVKDHNFVTIKKEYKCEK